MVAVGLNLDMQAAAVVQEASAPMSEERHLSFQADRLTQSRSAAVERLGLVAQALGQKEQIRSFRQLRPQVAVVVDATLALTKQQPVALVVVREVLPGQYLALPETRLVLVRPKAIVADLQRDWGINFPQVAVAALVP